MADFRYFARSTFTRSLVHKKHFGLMWQKIFKLEYLFCQRRQDTSPEFDLNWSQATVFLVNFVNNPKSKSCWLIFFGKCSSLVKIQSTSRNKFFHKLLIFLLLKELLNCNWIIFASATKIRKNVTNIWNCYIS